MCLFLEKGGNQKTKRVPYSKLVNVSRFGLDFSADLFYCLLKDLKYFTVAKPSILENTPSILLKQINHDI